jgi:hypothetical protein
MATSDDRELRSLAWLDGRLGVVYDMAYGVLSANRLFSRRAFVAPASMTATREGHEILAARMRNGALQPDLLATATNSLHPGSRRRRSRSP